MIGKKSLIGILIAIFLVWIGSVAAVYVWQVDSGDETTNETVINTDQVEPVNENSNINNESSAGRVRLTKDKYALSEKVEFNIENVNVEYCTNELPYRIIDSQGKELAIRHSCMGLVGHGYDQYCENGEVITRTTDSSCSDAIMCQTSKISGVFTWDQNTFQPFKEECNGETIKREIATQASVGSYTLLVTDSQGKVYNNKFEIGGTLKYECTSDDGCAIGGCSGEICGVKGLVEDIVSPCLYRSHYECYQYTTCGCVAGKCQWKDNPNYDKCFNERQSE